MITTDELRNETAALLAYGAETVRKAHWGEPSSHDMPVSMVLCYARRVDEFLTQVPPEHKPNQWAVTHRHNTRFPKRTVLMTLKDLHRFNNIISVMPLTLISHPLLPDAAIRNMLRKSQEGIQSSVLRSQISHLQQELERLENDYHE